MKEGVGFICSLITLVSSDVCIYQIQVFLQILTCYRYVTNRIANVQNPCSPHLFPATEAQESSLLDCAGIHRKMICTVWSKHSVTVFIWVLWNTDFSVQQGTGPCCIAPHSSFKLGSHLGTLGVWETRICLLKQGEAEAPQMQNSAWNQWIKYWCLN